MRAGYTREDVDRTFRIVEKTTEDTARASVDLTGIGWLTVRGIYEHGKRSGSPVDGLELLSIGEQPTLRQFDISDRNRDRFSAVVLVMPLSILSFNGSEVKQLRSQNRRLMAEIEAQGANNQSAQASLTAGPA